MVQNAGFCKSSDTRIVARDSVRRDGYLIFPVVFSSCPGVVSSSDREIQRL
jgi:hypothetical protein